MTPAAERFSDTDESTRPNVVLLAAETARLAWLTDSVEPLHTLFGPRHVEVIGRHAHVMSAPVGLSQLVEQTDVLSRVEVILATWGTPTIPDELLDRMPRLRAMFHAGGSPKAFTNLVRRGLTVVGGWQLNAAPVAEFALAHVILGLKQALPTAHAVRTRGLSGYRRPTGVAGAYKTHVGLLGYGAIARRLRALLRALGVSVLVHDPFISIDDARTDQVELVSIDALFARSQVVSVHLPSLPATRGIVTGDRLGLLPRHATFINTARGAVVDEGAMIDVLRRRQDLTAVLDVTVREPPPADSPLYTLANIWLTPHIAGAMGSEVDRIVDGVTEDFLRWLSGQTPHGLVTSEMVDRMA